MAIQLYLDCAFNVPDSDEGEKILDFLFELRADHLHSVAHGHPVVELLVVHLDHVVDPVPALKRAPYSHVEETEEHLQEVDVDRYDQVLLLEAVGVVGFDSDVTIAVADCRGRHEDEVQGLDVDQADLALLQALRPDVQTAQEVGRQQQDRHVPHEAEIELLQALQCVDFRWNQEKDLL